MDAAQVRPGEELQKRLEMLIGFAQHEIESFHEARRLDEEGLKDKNDIRAAVEWLKANMNFIIADAEFDGRI